MSIGLVFWVLMILWFILSSMSRWPGNQVGKFGEIGGAVLVFILFALVGWQIFGPVIHR